MRRSDCSRCSGARIADRRRAHPLLPVVARAVLTPLPAPRRQPLPEQPLPERSLPERSLPALVLDRLVAEPLRRVMAFADQTTWAALPAAIQHRSQGRTCSGPDSLCRTSNK
jgi:hypothetical protein